MEIKQLSLASLKQLWQESWDEDFPTNRLPAGKTQLGFYPITTFNVALDEEGRPISYRGWSETNGYFMLGMEYTREEHRKQGLHRKLAPSTRGKVILGLSQQNADYSNEDWINSWASKGYTINPTPEEVEEVFGEETPTTKAFAAFYSNKQGKAWAIKNTDKINKFSIIKSERYSRALGDKGYDVIDSSTGKRVNKTGLSKSRADAMLEAIKRGETDLTQYETKVKRKAKHANWKNILLKYLPDTSFEQYNIGEPVADLGTRDRFRNKTIESLGNVEHKAFVTEQYLRQVHDRLPSAGTDKMVDWLTKLNALNLNKGKYWFFGTNVYEDKTYVMINVINKDDRYLDTGKKFNLEGMDSAIVFIGVSKDMVGKIKRGETIPRGRKFIDLWGKGGVRGLQKKAGRRFPKEPVNIFNKWQDVLKLDPNSGGYKSLGFGDRENQHTSHPFMIKIVDGVAIIFNAHYHYRYDERKRVRLTIMTDSTARKYIAASAGRGQWSYINDDAKDFTHVIFDRLKSPNDYITRTNPRKLVKDIGKDPATGLPITEAVVFHHISDKDFDAPDKSKKFDVFYKGIKPDHYEKVGSTEKKRRNKNKDPVNIFSKKPFTSTPKPKPKTNSNRRKRSPNQQKRR
tara:strand:- start:40 stop:1923 length:1884 start_codon:yes stop_codon:yes gene_type:complete